jgi:hypothetical protein
VKRLEEVRLAGSVLADSEQDPRLERKLESRIRPIIAERERADDQPAIEAPLRMST